MSQQVQTRNINLNFGDFFLNQELYHSDFMYKDGKNEYVL